MQRCCPEVGTLVKDNCIIFATNTYTEKKIPVNPGNINIFQTYKYFQIILFALIKAKKITAKIKNEDWQILKIDKPSRVKFKKLKLKKF